MNMNRRNSIAFTSMQASYQSLSHSPPPCKCTICFASPGSLNNPPQPHPLEPSRLPDLVRIPLGAGHGRKSTMPMTDWLVQFLESRRCKTLDRFQQLGQVGYVGQYAGNVMLTAGSDGRCLPSRPMTAANRLLPSGSPTNGE